MANPHWRSFVGHLRGLYFWIIAIFQYFVPPARKNVSGKVVLVTGAGSGMGQKLSLEFAKLGCVVVGWDISAKGLQETEAIIKDHQLKLKWRAYECDLTDRHQVYATADKVKSEIGDVDILINNAGIVTGKSLLDCKDELMIKCMEVNAISHFWGGTDLAFRGLTEQREPDRLLFFLEMSCDKAREIRLKRMTNLYLQGSDNLKSQTKTLKAFLPAMIERNEGHVVTIASGAGLFGIAFQVDYAASKFAAVGLTEALNMELQLHNKRGVFTTTVCPYYVDTGMFHGVKSPIYPFCSILPLSKTEDVVEQIIDAVLRNKQLLIIPRILYIVNYLKGLVPVQTFVEGAIGSGIASSMEDFTGR